MEQTREETRLHREYLRRQKRDMERALRVVEHISCPAILPESPVELTEGYIFADRDEYAVFACFAFKNLSQKPLKRLDIRLDFYYYQNIPHTSLEFTYSQKELTFGVISQKGKALKPKYSNLRETVESGECFGDYVYIPITDIRYTSLKLILVSVEYGDSTVQPLMVTVGGNAKKINELDRVSKLVFRKANPLRTADILHPAKNLPQFGKYDWLCCCGTKNYADAEKCEKCQRERDLQRETISESALEQKKAALVSQPTAIAFHDKSKFAQNKYLENSADRLRKARESEKALENVAKAERARERRRGGALIKFCLWVLFFYIILFIIILIMIFADPGQDGDSFIKLIRKLLDGDTLFKLF